MASGLRGHYEPVLERDGLQLYVQYLPMDDCLLLVVKTPRAAALDARMVKVRPEQLERLMRGEKALELGTIRPNVEPQYVPVKELTLEALAFDMMVPPAFLHHGLALYVDRGRRVADMRRQEEQLARQQARPAPVVRDMKKVYRPSADAIMDVAELLPGDIDLSDPVLRDAYEQLTFTTALRPHA